MLKKILKNAFLISFFSIISISSTIFINKITKSKIILQKEKERNILLKKVLPPKILDKFEIKLSHIKNKSLGNDKNHNVWLLFNEKKQAIGAVIETTAPDGYSGSIDMLVAAYFNGTIIGVRVLSHRETPGIGDKIELSISDWITKFSDIYVSSSEDKSCVLKKYGGKIEQFTGATITPQAVTNTVKKTVIFIKKIPLILSFLNQDIYEN